MWIVLHSGSRGIGNQLAQGHIRLARTQAKEQALKLEDPDLAYFMQGTAEFEAYIRDMLWAQDYAMANRSAMMDDALVAFFAFVGAGQRGRADQLPPQLHDREKSTTARSSGSPARVRSRRTSVTWASSPARWARGRTS